MQEGWSECPSCKKEYFVRKIMYPFRDIAHSVNCPTCSAIVGQVPRGTDDYELQSKESFLNQQREDSLKPNCPNCGRKMVIKEGYSKFWGCPSFPKCDGIRRIEEID